MSTTHDTHEFITAFIEGVSNPPTYEDWARAIAVGAEAQREDTHAQLKALFIEKRDAGEVATIGLIEAMELMA